MTLLVGLPGEGALCASIYGLPLQVQTDQGIANGLSTNSTCRQYGWRHDPWLQGQTHALRTQRGVLWT